MTRPPEAPNPRRVAAGRLNRAKRKSLSPEGRERLRQSALHHRPWEHATGPCTPAGKARAALNGKARRKGPRSVRELRRLVVEVRGLVGAMAAARGQGPGVGALRPAQVLQYHQVMVGVAPAPRQHPDVGGGPVADAEAAAVAAVADPGEPRRHVEEGGGPWRAPRTVVFTPVPPGRRSRPLRGLGGPDRRKANERMSWRPAPVSSSFISTSSKGGPPSPGAST
jgi:hypothetical protein